MCCFSGAVAAVSGTEIFARSAPDGGQFLVYRMKLDLVDDVAMILPLPVPPRPADNAVRFVDLSGYEDFFTDLAKGFPIPAAFSGELARGGFAPQAPMLVVHDIGDFEASFVPTPPDFARLDARFRLPSEALNALPQYADFGFAVFRLRRRSGDVAKPRVPERKTYHPMAFAFPRRDPSTLFFPTVHLHDGQVHPAAAFDHTLYLQHAAGAAPGAAWWRSYAPVVAFANVARACGVLDERAYLYRLGLAGSHPNRDWVVPDQV
jgi:hypothetical protein